jgi:hypothetical protein
MSEDAGAPGVFYVLILVAVVAVTVAIVLLVRLRRQVALEEAEELLRKEMEPFE